ncbi:Transcriptional regulator, LacI family [uncultured Pleomorphomonas sp.]|uniref:Transcriptional regulator, LacI family n=1 Tax=uncultured Pleomorphomonas sp. TaxID=442121 RepID=A0A212LND7_9HYPH|nr:LacI family DNA-binding transcriptional regulator [uncultured Pleomorphomonas sp.]SCM79044.1 Transcriptional regulator, LacI family [uncultured Pleomorphomonas sp.]
MSSDTKQALPGEPPRSVTISDVALEAGVSKAAVSRFLGGRFELVSAQNQAQIEAAIGRLGYRPNRLARGLKRGRTRLIGFVAANATNPYSVEVMRSAERACRARGYSMMLCNSADDPATEQDILDTLAAYSVEGIILHTTSERHKTSARTTDEMKVVLLDRLLAGSRHDYVGLDNADACRQATQHLIGNGFRDIAFVSETIAGVSTREERSSVFLSEAARHAGVRGRIIEADLADESALAALVAAFVGDRDGSLGPKAMIAGSGITTLRVVRAIHRLGLAMPDDLGFIGFDELEWSPLVSGGITTIAQPTDAIGGTAVSHLMDRIGGDLSPRRKTVFQGQLIARRSSAAV